MTAVYRRRKDRPGGSSWADAQRNAPGGFVPRHRRNRDRFSPESEIILRWLVGRGLRSAQEVHLGAFPTPGVLWTLGSTSSRLGRLAAQGYLKRHPGGLYEAAEKPKSKAKNKRQNTL